MDGKEGSQQAQQRRASQLLLLSACTGQPFTWKPQLRLNECQFEQEHNYTTTTTTTLTTSSTRI